MVKLNDIVMRHMVVKLDAEGSLEYQKPQSLEDAPSRDVGNFLRENKMGGLFGADKAGSDLDMQDDEDLDDIENDDEAA
jgi:hypothetical protein